MRAGYRKITRSLLLLLIFSTAALFVYPIKDGRPLLSLNKVRMSSMPDISLPAAEAPGPASQAVSTPVTVYKWQDEEGGWHFSNEPPAPGTAYETTAIDPNVNLLQSGAETALPSDPTDDVNGRAEKEAAFDYSPEKISRILEQTDKVREAAEQRYRAQKAQME